MRKEGQTKPRKAYAKPCIAIEDFTLNQFIANCTIKTRFEGWQDELMAYSYLDYLAIVVGGQFGYKMDCEVDAREFTGNGDTVCYFTSTSPLFTS
jgi:hypothetical protein